MSAEPIQTAILSPDGLQPTAYSADSLAEAAKHEPDGVYTLTRTFERDKALLLDAHLDRLEESARLEGIALRLNRPMLRAALREMIQGGAYAESRFRLTIPRHQPELIYIALEPLHSIPPELRAKGIKVASLPIQRANPSAKNNAWMQQRAAALAALSPDVYEGMLISDEGFILEGASSNFYAVLDGELRTADAGILSGIARKALLEVAPQVLPVRLEPIHLDDLPQCSEAFLTSSSRGVLAIVAFDAVIIGNGQPGAITQALAQAYEAWTAAHLETI